MRSWSAELAGVEDAFQRPVQVRRAQRIAAGALDANQGDDVARTGLRHVLALVGVHADDAADAEVLVCACVAAGLALYHAALVHARVRKLPERLVDDLEGQGHERGVGVAHQRRFGPGVVVIAGHVLAVQRAWQIRAHGVKQRLNALVLERRA
jgi:hypothetical protein